MTARDEEERQVQHEKDVHLPKKVSSSITTIQGCMEDDQSQDRHEESSSELKKVEVKDIERGSTICWKQSPAVIQTGVRLEVVR